MTVLRVVICEDSRTYAAGLRRMLEYDGDIVVQAVFATAEEAVAALPRLKPDLLTMDLELPGMNGLEAVGKIMASGPLPILVMSAHVGPGSNNAAAALAAGALDALAKDDLDLRDPAGALGAAFRHRVRALSRARVIHHPRATLRAGRAAPGLPRRASVIGLCASAGGPQLLLYLLGALPADYPIPILIVQHMAAGFTEELARWLGESVAIPVGIAVPGARAAPGAWLAPEGAHLELAVTGRLSLDRHTLAGAHRPSGDVLLQSIAAAAGRAGVAVVLTGMGRDGAVGAAAVRHSGGLSIAQDEPSSAIFGMPKAAIDLGAEIVLSAEEIAACLGGLRPEPLGAPRG
jgi:two-component system, chemotaxis family, protein-glutamate methylesterase/glutaminase